MINSENHYIIGWLLIVMGWVVINQQHNRRAERAELRAHINEISEAVEALSSQARKYHISASHSSELAADIKLATSKLTQKIRIYNLRSKEISLSIINLRKSITYNNFDAADKFQTQGDGSLLLSDIFEAEQNLIDALEDCFTEQFRTKLWERLIKSIRTRLDFSS